MKVLWIEGQKNYRANINAFLRGDEYEIDFCLPQGFRLRDNNEEIPTFDGVEDLGNMLKKGDYDLLIVNREEFKPNRCWSTSSEFANYVRDITSSDYIGLVRATIDCIDHDMVKRELGKAGISNLICYEKSTTNPLQIVMGEPGIIF